MSNECQRDSYLYPDYFSNWRQSTFTCNECSWSGLGDELSIEPFNELFETHCPKCYSKFHIISYPNLEELRVAAASCNEEAQAELAQRKESSNRHESRVKSYAGRERFPDLHGDTLTFTFYTESGTDWMNPEWLVLACDGVEIHREGSGYEHWEPLVEISKILLTKYKGRIQLIDVERALSVLCGDDLRAASTVKEFLEKAGVSQ